MEEAQYMVSVNELTTALADITNDDTGSDSLHAFYGRTMRKVESQPGAAQRRAKEVISCTIFSFRPLTVDEFCHTFGIHVGHPSNVGRLDIEDIILPRRGLADTIPNTSPGAPDVVGFPHIKTERHVRNKLSDFAPGTHRAMTRILLDALVSGDEKEGVLQLRLSDMGLARAAGGAKYRTE